jgi:hypothetical protein
LWFGIYFRTASACSGTIIVIIPNEKLPMSNYQLQIPAELLIGNW